MRFQSFRDPVKSFEDSMEKSYGRDDILIILNHDALDKMDKERIALFRFKNWGKSQRLRLTIWEVNTDVTADLVKGKQLDNIPVPKSGKPGVVLISVNGDLSNYDDFSKNSGVQAWTPENIYDFICANAQYAHDTPRCKHFLEGNTTKVADINVRAHANADKINAKRNANSAAKNAAPKNTKNAKNVKNANTKKNTNANANAKKNTNANANANAKKNANSKNANANVNV
jgi:hypothetical protein